MFSRLKAWWRGRGTSSQPEQEADGSPLSVEEDALSQSPREQHYVFAHQLLPGWYFDNPAGFIASVTRPAGFARLQEIWNDLGSKVKSRGGEKIPDAGLVAARVAVRGQPAALLSFPRTQGLRRGVLRVPGGHAGARGGPLLRPRADAGPGGAGGCRGPRRAV